MSYNAAEYLIHINIYNYDCNLDTISLTTTEPPFDCYVHNEAQIVVENGIPRFFIEEWTNRDLELAPINIMMQHRFVNALP